MYTIGRYRTDYEKTSVFLRFFMVFEVFFMLFNGFFLYLFHGSVRYRTISADVFSSKKTCFFTLFYRFFLLFTSISGHIGPFGTVYTEYSGTEYSGVLRRCSRGAHRTILGVRAPPNGPIWCNIFAPCSGTPYRTIWCAPCTVYTGVSSDIARYGAMREDVN